jgi:hypothetical protein
MLGKVAGTLADGYINISIDGTVYRAHRLAWLYVHGVFPKEIDHKNRIRSDNRISNLRVVTRTRNNFNRSNVKGYTKRNGKYRAQITYLGKNYSLGQYDTTEEATEAYHTKRREFLGEIDRGL